MHWRILEVSSSLNRWLHHRKLSFPGPSIQIRWGVVETKCHWGATLGRRNLSSLLRNLAGCLDWSSYEGVCCEIEGHFVCRYWTKRTRSGSFQDKKLFWGDNRGLLRTFTSEKSSKNIWTSRYTTVEEEIYDYGYSPFLKRGLSLFHEDL